MQAAKGIENLSRRQPVGNAGGGRHIAELPTDTDRIQSHIAASHASGVCCRREKRGNHTQSRCFTSPIGTEQSYDLTRKDVQGYAINGMHHAAIAGAVVFDEISDIDRRFWQHPTPSLARARSPTFASNFFVSSWTSS